MRIMVLLNRIVNDETTDKVVFMDIRNIGRDDSAVPAHVEMMGFLGIGNNPMVGCTVACAVDVAQALSK